MNDQRDCLFRALHLSRARSAATADGTERASFEDQASSWLFSVSDYSFLIFSKLPARIWAAPPLIPLGLPNTGLRQTHGRPYLHAETGPSRAQLDPRATREPRLFTPMSVASGRCSALPPLRGTRTGFLMSASVIPCVAASGVRPESRCCVLARPGEDEPMLYPFICEYLRSLWVSTGREAHGPISPSASLASE